MQKTNEFPVKLASPALRALANAKITTLQQLAKYSEEQVGSLHGIGSNAVATLKEALKKNSLSFKIT